VAGLYADFAFSKQRYARLWRAVGGATSVNAGPPEAWYRPGRYRSRY